MLKISNTSCSIARGCWMKYYWHYIEKLEPIKKSTALTLGSIMHEAFEQYYSGATDSDTLNYIQKRYDEEIAKATDDTREYMETDKYTAMGMWAYYPHKDLTCFDKIDVEKEFSITLPNLRRVRFVGKVDGLVKMNGKWWVREVKTTGLSPRQFIGRCACSDQATAYVYAMRRLGFPVQGVMYDCIKRPLLRKRTTETVDDFGKRIMADYRDDLKKPESARKAYIRLNEFRPNYRIQQWQDSINRLVKAIRYRKRHDDWYRNMDQCWNYNSLCPYARVCHMETPDELTMKLFYTRRGI